MTLDLTFRDIVCVAGDGISIKMNDLLLPNDTSIADFTKCSSICPQNTPTFSEPLSHVMSCFKMSLILRLSLFCALIPQTDRKSGRPEISTGISDCLQQYRQYRRARPTTPIKTSNATIPPEAFQRKHKQKRKKWNKNATSFYMIMCCK